LEVTVTDVEADAALRLLMSGELSGLECLYLGMRTAVFATALAITRDPHLAQDVLQDTFVRVATRAGTYRPGTRPRAWLIAIARNLAVDAMRQSRRDSGRLSRGECGETDVDLADTAALTRALLSLGEIDRQIVVLHTIGGFTHAEVAADLAIPAVTVRWRYRAALVRLRASFEGDSDG
jgi:RNA polymerase sigma-70 factor (ECF subfamily)